MSETPGLLPYPGMENEEVDEERIQRIHILLDIAYNAIDRRDSHAREHVERAIREARASEVEHLVEAADQLEKYAYDAGVFSEVGYDEDDETDLADHDDEGDAPEDYCRCGMFHWECACSDIERARQEMEEAYYRDDEACY